MAAETRGANAVQARRHMTVTGRVQGVGYRYTVVMAARRLGVSGWVRNCRDGSVECEAQGTDRQLDDLEARMRVGSQWSRVADIAVQDVPPLAGPQPPFAVRG
ncbi:acylphosphatase [Bifidobacterium avesanii]|uniref:acylphosphatase n=1 Tax=Bifidobacterium avesanii TaxID=1798157 RepID=A0A7K3TIV6_9BIFI|nr:acylphosphatase [Bifidobacterium avesanii]KAB8292034.1 acylphosphatase [Bifidobacterium avesanii]NEG78604.1 acylphosphatase [Bifidobacterium avesanii]